MRVRVVDVAATILMRRHEPAAVVTCSVDIGERCVVCGGPRGEPIPYLDERVCVEFDIWTNPCGHVDTHEDALLEARVNRVKQRVDAQRAWQSVLDRMVAMDRHLIATGQYRQQARYAG